MTHSPSLFSPHDITTMRNLARLSQKELAEALGYTQSTIAYWETGRKLMQPHAYIPFLDVIMARFVLLDYLTERKSYLLHITVIHQSYSLPSFAITAP